MNTDHVRRFEIGDAVGHPVSGAGRAHEVEAMIRNVRASMEKAANLGKNISPEVLAIIANLEDAGRLADLIEHWLELSARLRLAQLRRRSLECLGQ